MNIAHIFFTLCKREIDPWQIYLHVHASYRDSYICNKYNQINYILFVGDFCEKINTTLHINIFSDKDNVNSVNVVFPPRRHHSVDVVVIAWEFGEHLSSVWFWCNVKWIIGIILYNSWNDNSLKNEILL